MKSLNDTNKLIPWEVKGHASANVVLDPSARFIYDQLTHPLCQLILGPESSTSPDKVASCTCVTIFGEPLRGMEGCFKLPCGIVVDTFVVHNMVCHRPKMKLTFLQTLYEVNAFEYKTSTVDTDILAFVMGLTNLQKIPYYPDCNENCLIQN